MRDRISIVGSMGAGKTTVAGLLAERLGIPVFDSDRWILEQTGINARLHAGNDGVDALHVLERRAVEAALLTPGGIIITPAASVADNAALLGRLTEESMVVWLDVHPDVAIARARSGRHRRPIDRDSFTELHLRRSAAFGEACHLRLDGDRASSDLALEIAEFAGSDGRPPPA